MKLTYPKLDLVPGPETVAFRAVDQVLRSDPVLPSICKMFVSWRGDIEDVWEPSTTTCPFLRISAGGLGSSWETEGQHRMPMAVAIEAAVIGSDFDQIGNFWAAIRSALFPPRPDKLGSTARSDWVRTRMQAAGISRGILTAPAYTIKLDEGTSGARIIRADGTLELVLLVSTP